jgi:hypothetical protein
MKNAESRPKREPLEFVFVERPRCRKCDSPRLKPYKRMPEESDGSFTQYAKCLDCGKKQKIICE